MEAELDQTVELCASLLTSEDPVALSRACNVLKKLHEGGRGYGERFARVAQEIATYEGGALLWRILRGTLWQQCACHQEKIGFEQYVGYLAVLGTVTASKVVVERCLRGGEGSEERENALDLYRRLFKQADQVFLPRVENAGGMTDKVYQLILVVSFECLANCARASKVFRDAMREATEQRDIFKNFKKFLSPDFISKRMRADLALKTRVHLAGIAVSLAFSADSQLWAIDRGLLKLVAAIYEASPLRERCKLSKRSVSPAFRCNQALLRLLTLQSAAEKLRAHNALEGFRPHKRKINSAEPEQQPWARFERILQGTTTSVLSRELSAEEWKDLEEKLSGDFWTPVVCSWKLCRAGREPAVGREFGKCARCHVARYCSKEHQKLHWTTHKIHCKGFGNQTGAESCTKR